MTPGIRGNFHNLTVTRVTNYQSREGTDMERTVYRYAFRGKEGRRYVYSGKYMGFRAGQIVSIRGTIKTASDNYGFIRLSRIRSIPSEDILI